MKTDRELLELAARAAGMDAYWDEECQRMQMDYLHKGGTNYEEWNPLTDDGDALRLAVKLELIVRCYNGSIIVDGCGENWIEEHDMTDRYAATRRAIVRAAAAIGEGMK